MDDAPVAVAALAGQVEGKAALALVVFLVGGEGHALVDQPLDRLTAVFDGEAHRVLAAQAGAGGQGVLHVRFDVVAVVEYRRHAALGPVGRAAGEVALAQHGHAQVRRQVEGQGQTGTAAADDQDVVLIVLAHGLPFR
ncbi:hypothetical protein D3C78_1073030 [compost metagenome]